MSKIQQFVVELPGIGTVVSVSVPTWCEEVALRVQSKYVPPMPPPLPAIAIVTFSSVQPPGDPTYNTRYFVIWDDTDLPAQYVKYIATVPFGPDKQTTHIIEVDGPIPPAV